MSALAVEVFHLQGGHDQQNHAGDRASTLGDVDPDDDGVYVELHDDLWDVQSQLNLSDLEIQVEDAWREDAARSTVYHGTRDGETAESILRDGLQTMNETRGINNRWVGSAVYTTTEPEMAREYGNVFEVDLPRAIADGVVSADDLQREPGFNEADAMSMIASSFEDYDFDAYSQFIGTGEDPQTVVIGAPIPPEYLTYDEDGTQFSVQVFHLQGQHDQKDHGRRGGVSGEFAPITAAEKRGNSRAVSNEEFQRLATIGRAQLDELAANSSPIEALDASWDSIRDRALSEAQKSWGGATIDSHTGEFLPDGADKFALTVKDSGFETVSVPEGAGREEFMTAMDAAKEKFRPILERQNHYLGVFHDDDLGRIDFDPVTVVDTIDEVETIGAATRAIGGAYRFSDGNGYWPPHVDEDAVVASGSMGQMGDEITKFKGPAEWKRQAKQLEGAPDAAPAPKKARKFRAPVER